MRSSATVRRFRCACSHAERSSPTSRCFVARLQHALSFRASLDLDATAFRIVHAEADLLPSLVVDKYADYLVVQALSQGMDRLLPSIVSMLVELTSPPASSHAMIKGPPA